MRKKTPKIVLSMIFLLRLVLPAPAAESKHPVILQLDSDIRSYFLNDQRIQWSGAETSFGAEAVLRAGAEKSIGGVKAEAFGEFRINQPFDDNFLRDEFRDRYLGNFKVDTFQISQMYLGIKSGSFEIFLGKKRSVFGSDNLIRLTNSEIFQPFIRTESVLQWETGFFASIKSGVFRLDLSLVNGGPERDTNSSKAAVIRAGLSSGSLALGVSAKYQDGIGSEWQKQYKNHIGFDLTFRAGRFIIAAEGIYDEYGFRKEFDSDNIFWKRSFYYRDLFFQPETPITGIGGYVDLRYEWKKLIMNVNYGEFHPEEIGNPYHDTPVKRTILKIIYTFSGDFSLFFGGLFENERPREPVFSGASGLAYITGIQLKI